jgi:hypothetical protein
VCLVRSGGTTRVEASGFKPGSDLIVSSPLLAQPQTYPIGSDGALKGAVGILAATPQSVEVSVEGVAADGEQVEGNVRARD